MTTTQELDETHDAGRASWVASAQGHAGFPLQNLPLGVFSPPGGTPRGGIAIGDSVLDIGAMLDAGLLDGAATTAAQAARGPTLNALLALGAAPRRALRRAVFAALATNGKGSERARRAAGTLLHDAARCTIHLPAAIGAYTDFYAGIEHAANGGRRRGQNPPLQRNYKYVPVAYHSRASSIRPSGAVIRRPNGQRVLDGDTDPTFGPCRKLDFELEVGIWIGPGNGLEAPIPIGAAAEHVAGLCLLNDWSARDIQRWESQPLGPFLAKNFGTTISCWIVTPEALAPFRIAQPPRPAGDPPPLAYLHDDTDQQAGAFDIDLEVLISTSRMRERGLPPERLSRSNMRHLYWTAAQMVAHHTCGGCNLAPGDLFGTGTISAPDASGYGSIAELSFDGTRPITLASGETRTFLEDGDEVTLAAHARRPGYATIGFGECRGRIG